MVRQSPDKQWNCQNSILFYETIPLSKKTFSKRNRQGRPKK
jgi:hypothetical protein